MSVGLRAIALALLLASCSEQIPGDPCDDTPCELDAGLDDVAMDDAPSFDVPASDARLDAGVATPDARDVAIAADVRDVTSSDVRDVPVAIDLPPVVDAPPMVDVPPAVDVRPAVDVPATGGCVSGAVGTHVARFRWTGSTSGSRASVSYEANTLPDRSRWRVTANSRSIGYTPVFSDPFLGEGGLELATTAFIDVELSTVGLSRIAGVTLALYGRSFNTGASGSFAWQTFAGTGAAPSGLVANSAPYRWYRADATAAFDPGNGSLLLRITPGPPSGALIVSRFEVCFDAP